MKRYLSILLAAVTIFTVSCKKDTTKDNDNKDTKANPTTTIAAPTATPTANIMPSEPPKSEEPTEETTTTIPGTEAPTESATPSETQGGNMSTPTLVPSVDNTQSPSASEPTATIKPTVAPTAKPTVKPTAQPTKAPTSKPTVSAAAGTPPYKYTKEEHRQIAAEVVKEINKLRNVQLIVLPGLTKYAEYRAKQLETNFAHDGKDIQAAANALKYGRYCDTPPSQAVLEIIKQNNPDYVFEPYYQSEAAEAISINGNPDTVAAGLKRSAGHWKYVGSDEYLYIGVGVSEAINQWGGRGSLVYCVCVAMVNTDLLK